MKPHQYPPVFMINLLFISSPRPVWSNNYRPAGTHYRMNGKEVRVPYTAKTTPVLLSGKKLQIPDVPISFLQDKIKNEFSN